MITMMRRYRRTLQIGLLVVIAAFVATSVFIAGSGSLRGDSDAGVAKVNGETISVERYQRRYQELVNMYAASFREFSPDMAERMGLPQQTVQSLIQEALIVQRARAERLEATDEEVNVQIQAIPAFFDNGRFSLKRYEDVLRRVNLTPAAFEDDMRRRVTRAKVEGIVRSGAKLTPGELEQAFVRNREEVRAAWALVELAPLIAATTATEAELETYLKNRATEFRLPDRRKVQYVIFVPKDFARPASDAEVEKYYTDHLKEFEAPRQAKAAHILVRVPEKGGSDAEDKARAKIVGAIRRAKAGEDFAKLAKELSEDPASAANGGDLGLVRKGEIVADLEEALFALKRGEVSPAPVRTPFGFHALMVTEVQEGGRKPLREVAPQIRERLQAEAAEQAAKAKATEVRATLLGSADFMTQAKSLGLFPVEGTIPRRERVPGLAPPDPVEETTFGLAKGGVSMPVKTPGGFIVLRALEDIPASVPPLAVIRDQVTASLKREKAEAAALERAKVIVAEAKASDFVTAAHKAVATVGEAPRFSRAKPADKLPGDAMVAALRVPVGVITEPVKTPQGYYVLKVLERVAPDMKELDADRDKLQQEVLTRKQAQAWQDWLTAARAGAKIETSAARLPAGRG